MTAQELIEAINTAEIQYETAKDDLAQLRIRLKEIRDACKHEFGPPWHEAKSIWEVRRNCVKRDELHFCLALGYKEGPFLVEIRCPCLR